MRLVRNWPLMKPRKSMKSTIALRICSGCKPYGMIAFGLNPSGCTGAGVQARVSLLGIHALLRQSIAQVPRAFYAIRRDAGKTTCRRAGEPTAEADRGRHLGFPGFNFLAGDPGQLSRALGPRGGLGRWRCCGGHSA